MPTPKTSPHIVQNFTLFWRQAWPQFKSIRFLNMAACCFKTWAYQICTIFQLFHYFTVNLTNKWQALNVALCIVFLEFQKIITKLNSKNIVWKWLQIAKVYWRHFNYSIWQICCNVHLSFCVFQHSDNVCFNSYKILKRS